MERIRTNVFYWTPMIAWDKRVQDVNVLWIGWFGLLLCKEFVKKEL